MEEAVKKPMESSRGPKPSRLLIEPGGVYGGKVACLKGKQVASRPAKRNRRFRFAAAGAIFAPGKSHFPEQKSLPCSFCARKSERFQQKLVGVCLHSYNDTVSANTGVIIERCFRGFPPLEGMQILSSVPSLLCDALRCHPAWITSHGQYTFCSPKRYPTYHSRVSTWCFSKSYQVSI